MGFFGSKSVSDKELRDFARGKNTDAKVAKAYAEKQADKKASQKAMRENRAARKKGIK